MPGAMTANRSSEPRDPKNGPRRLRSSYLTSLLIIQVKARDLARTFSRSLNIEVMRV